MTRTLAVVAVLALAACGGSEGSVETPVGLPAIPVDPAVELHGVCFPLALGNHAGVTCLQCHVTLPVPLQIGSCSSVPYPSCTRCHSCASVQPKHLRVVNFSCVNLDQRCYECHPRGSR